MQDLLTYAVRYSSSQFKEMDIKEKITELLLSTGRENIGNVLEYMESNGFFTAPASVSNHNNNEGGLAKHSLDVYEEAMRLNSQLARPLPTTSVTLCSLLHDICKSDQYYMNDKGVACRDNEKIKRGHGVRSMFILKRRCLLPLNYDEEMAIWWHMRCPDSHSRPYERERRESENIPLCRLIQEADRNAANQSGKKKNATGSEVSSAGDVAQ